MVGRKNVNITPWWVTMLRTLRTTVLNYCLSCSTIPCCMLCIFGGRIYVVKREKPLKSKEGYNISKKVFFRSLIRFQVSISPTFCEQLFHTKVFSTCNFLAKNIGAKAAHKMLVKFTTGLLLSLSLSSRANYLFS